MEDIKEIYEDELSVKRFANMLFSNWKSGILYDERIFLNIKEDLKLRIDRIYDKKEGILKYDGVLFINISKDIDDEDWRVATAIIKNGGFKCNNDGDLFSNIIAILLKIGEDTVTITKMLGDREETIEISFKKLA